MIAFIRRQVRFLGVALALGFFSTSASAQMYCAVEEWGCNYYYTQHVWQAPAQFDTGIATAAMADGLPGGIGAVEVMSDGFNPAARVCANGSWTGWYYLLPGVGPSASPIVQYMNGMMGSQWQSMQLLNSFHRIGTYC